MAKQKRYKTKEGTYMKDRKYGEFKSSLVIPSIMDLRSMGEKKAKQTIGSKMGAMLKSKDIPIHAIKVEDMADAVAQLKRDYARQFSVSSKEANEWYARQRDTALKLAKGQNKVSVFSDEERMVQYFQAKLIANDKMYESIHKMIEEKGKDNVDLTVYPELAAQLGKRDMWGNVIDKTETGRRETFRLIPTYTKAPHLELSSGSWSEIGARSAIAKAILRTSPDYYDVRVEQAKLGFLKALDSYIIKEVSMFPPGKWEEMEEAIKEMPPYKFEEMYNEQELEMTYEWGYDYYDIDEMLHRTRIVLRHIQRYTGVDFNL